jgi:SPOR domain
MNLLVAGGCMLQNSDTSKLAAAGLIATPVSHYSTQKARYLGEKYKDHLNRLVERLIANPKTTNLQFANNVASAGGIGFFTHSAVKVPDERFLEVVLGTVETFEAKGDYSAKIARLFSLYGRELLTILASDLDIYNDRELSGYGLNFTWRTVGPAVASERVIVYFPKERVNAFLKQELSENVMLAAAVIFAMEQEGLANLVSFRGQEPTPDVRAPIQEQVLLAELPKANVGVKPLLTNPVASNEENVDRPKSQGPVGSESQKERRPIQTEGSLKLRSPNPSIPVFPGTAPEQHVGFGKTDEPVVSDFKSNVPLNSNQAHTVFADSGTTTEGGRDAAGSVEEVIANVRQGVAVPETKAENRFNSDPLLESNQREDVKSNLGRSASNLPMSSGQSSASKDSKLPLRKDKLTSPAEIPPALSKELKPQDNFENPKELVTREESPKPAKIEPPRTELITVPKSNEATDALRQELALLREGETKQLPERKSLVGPLPRVLEGYIIQLVFKDDSEARRWGAIFQQRGYAVSTTKSETADSLRVRIGNFSVRDDAERELKSIRKDGLTGIILNLPQAYRPDVHSSLP